MNNDAIEQELAILRNKIESMSLWRAFSATPVGKKAIAAQEQAVDDIRRLYYAIEPTSEGAAVKLAYIQGREKEAFDMLQTMKVPDATAKILDTKYENMRKLQHEKGEEPFSRGGLLGKQDGKKE